MSDPGCTHVSFVEPVLCCDSKVPGAANNEVVAVRIVLAASQTMVVVGRQSIAV